MPDGHDSGIFREEPYRRPTGGGRARRQVPQPDPYTRPRHVEEPNPFARPSSQSRGSRSYSDDPHPDYYDDHRRSGARHGEDVPTRAAFTDDEPSRRRTRAENDVNATRSRRDDGGRRTRYESHHREHTTHSVADEDPDRPRSRGRRDKSSSVIEPTRESLRRSLGLTAASTVLPGIGLLGAKPRWARLLGVMAPLTFLVCVGAVGYVAVTDFGRLAGLAVNPKTLTIALILVPLGAIAWMLLITATHLLTRPPGMRTGRRTLGAILVTTLTFVIGAPMAVGARYALSSLELVNGVFKPGDDINASGRPELGGPDPWAHTPRLNILMLGADSTAARIKDNNGIYVPRTDTIMVASIDTKTGATTIIQIPRNVQYTPFPAGSKLAKEFPKGFTGDGDSQEWFVNAIWERTVSGDYPKMAEAVGDATYPGAEALKQGIEGITGLQMHYFMLVNIDGLQKLIDAMGGVTVNINKKLPIGGDTDAGIKPHGYLKPGPNQHLDGYHAMWYARGRYGLTDYDRMARQSCLVGAVIRQANPSTLLTSYEAIAKASQDMVMTDIPAEALQPIVQLAVKVKDANVTRLRFSDGENGYTYGNPDFPQMHRAVQAALGITVAQPSASPTPTAPATTAPTSSAPQSKAPSKSSKKTTAPAPSPSATTSAPPAETVSDACAYHPEEEQ